MVKIRLQAQQKAPTKCFLYCNGLMDHFCGCGPETIQKQWFERPGPPFNGTIVILQKILLDMLSQYLNIYRMHL